MPVFRGLEGERDGLLDRSLQVRRLLGVERTEWSGSMRGLFVWDELSESHRGQVCLGVVARREAACGWTDLGISAKIAFVCDL